MKYLTFINVDDEITRLATFIRNNNVPYIFINGKHIGNDPNKKVEDFTVFIKLKDFEEHKIEKAFPNLFKDSSNG